MRLLFIANDFPSRYKPHKGVFNLHLARALAAKNQVKVVSPVPWVDEVRAIRSGASDLAKFHEDRLAGVEVVYPRYYYPPRVLQDHYGWFYWQSVRHTVGALLNVYAPDAVMAYWAHPDGEAAVRAARLQKVPSAVIVGGSDVLLLTRDAGRRRAVVNVLQATDAVVCVSQDLRNRTIDLGVAQEKVHVWTQGVDLSLFHPGDRSVARQRLGLPEHGAVAVWVGRMVPVKGLDVLLDAVSLLRRRGVSLRVVLVGDGPLRESLEVRVAELGLSTFHLVCRCCGASPPPRLVPRRRFSWCFRADRRESQMSCAKHRHAARRL